MTTPRYTNVVLHGDGTLWWVEYLDHGVTGGQDLPCETEADARITAAAMLDVDVDADGANLPVEYH